MLDFYLVIEFEKHVIASKGIRFASIVAFDCILHISVQP